MIYPRIALVITAAAAVMSCSETGNPQLDMCKKITGNLVGAAEYGEISETKNKLSMQLALPFTANGESTEAVCVFAADPNFEGQYQTSPKEMYIDGMAIDQKLLMKASFASTKGVLKDTAEETKKQTAEAAEEAKLMANEAKDKATVLAAEAKDKAGEVATQIKDSEVVGRAKELADDATGAAKAKLLEGTKKLQESLEN